MITEENSVSESGIVTAADGTLVIIVCRAKHLPNRRKLDKQNPYCTLRIGTVAEKTSSIFRGGQTPEWTTEVRFQLSRERKPILKLDVLDETKNDPTPIGNGEIDCSPVFAKNEDGKHIYDAWHELSLNGRQAGIIYLEMTFYPSAPILPTKIIDDEPHMVRRVLHSTYPVPQQIHHFPEHEPTYYSPSHHSSNHGSNHSSARNTAPPSISNSRSSYSSNKNLPLPPPNHPSKKIDHTAGVFVSAKDKKERTWRNNPIFARPSSKTSPSKISPSSSPDLDNGDGTFGNDQKKEKSRLLRIADKLNSHEPLNTLWKKHSPSGSINSDTSYSQISQDLPKYKSHQDLDLLQREVQQDWNIGNNHNIYDDEDEDGGLYQVSQKPALPIHELPKLPNRSGRPLLIDSDTDSDDDADSFAPAPPPHNASRLSNSIKFQPFVPSIKSTSPSRKATRKPPPSDYDSSLLGAMSGLKLKDIPFSADDIGADDESIRLPRKVFLFDKEVTSISEGNDDEVYDTSYYAPTPNEHFSKNMRLQHGNIRNDDLEIDPGESGYLGSGRWEGNVESQYSSRPNMENEFSPNIFDRKPGIPPKIPIGLTEKEYYVIERDQYIKDINGRRA